MGRDECGRDEPPPECKCDRLPARVSFVSGKGDSMIRRISQFALLISTIPAILPGQSYTASVRGIITDASHAAIPSVHVTVTCLYLISKESATTDNAGRYVITALPAGHYTLSAEAQGF